MHMIPLAFAAILATHSAIAGNETIPSFERAKSKLNQLYEGHHYTIYSGCLYTENRRVDYAQCHYLPRHHNMRAYRIEWEHVVPAEAFGQAFVAWRAGDPQCVDKRGHHFRGRRCAARVDSQYRHMEGDLYNLYPEIGEINRLRSNYSMAEIPDEGAIRLASLAIKLGHRKFEPRPEVKGDIARTYLYMHAAYPGHGIISHKNINLFLTWDRADPVDQWECLRALRIEKIQGNENPFVMQACLKAKLIVPEQRPLATSKEDIREKILRAME